MARMKSRHGNVHDRTDACEYMECTRVEEPKRRMMGPPHWTHWSAGAGSVHVGEHDERWGCRIDPKCTPVEEEKPMEFKITTEYQEGSLWCYTLQSPDGVGDFDRTGYPSRDSAKRAAEGRADTLAKASVKPETYTYQGKLT